MSELVVIGWREWVDLPEWGIRVRAKADTGACSSAIDCANIQERPGGRVRFSVRLDASAEALTLEADIVKRTRVRSSTGHGAERLFVQTTLRLAGREKPIILGLACRKSMNHRMLLGREALADDFLVNSAESHWVTPRRRKKSKRN